MKKTAIWILALLAVLILVSCGNGQTEGTDTVTDGHIHNIIIDEALPATCKDEGLTEGSHCSVCNEVLSAQEVIPPTYEHCPSEFVIENNTEATCAKNGSYDEVVYCSVCTAELTRITKSTELTEHTPAGFVVENTIDSTCSKIGSLDMVVYCTVCRAELSRTTRTIDRKPHVYNGLKCVDCNADKESYGLFYTSNGDGTCTIVRRGNCTDTEIIIPKTSPAGDTVVSIGSEAFYGYKDIVSVVIPDTVKTIGEHAFAHCTALENVVLPDGLMAWEAYVFADCRQLKLTEHNGMYYLASTSNPYFLLISVEDTTKNLYEIHPDAVYINNHAFNDCKALVEIVIPDKIKGIGMWAFLGCSALKKVELPDSLEVIDSLAFQYCKSLESIIIPSGVTEIRKYAFDACTSLESIVFENTVGWRFIEGSSDKTGTAFDVSSPIENAVRLKKGLNGSLVRD